MPSEETTEKPEEVTLLPIVLIALILLAIILLWFSRVEEKPEVKPPEVKVVNVTGLQIAEMSIHYIESMRNLDGSYNIQRKCLGKTCEIIKSHTQPHTNAWPALAYVGLYRATNNTLYLKKINEETSLLVENCKKETDKCLWSLVQMYDAYKVTGDQDYNEFLINDVADTFWRYFYFDDNYNPMLLAILGREAALLYDLTKNKTFIALAIVAIETSEMSQIKKNRVIFERKNITMYETSCWTQLAKIDLYRVTGNKKYYDEVDNFFSTLYLGNYVERGDRSRFHFSVDVEPCIETLLKLYDISQKQEYLDDAYALSNYLANDMWDSSISKKFVGDNAFLAFRCESINLDYQCYENSKINADTAYAIYLFSLQNDTKFTIRKTS